MTFTNSLITLFTAPSWSWPSIQGQIDPFSELVDAPLIVILDIQTESSYGDRFGQLTGGHLIVRGMLFEFPSLELWARHKEQFYKRRQYNPWAFILDDCRDHYHKNKTWFLPVAVSSSAFPETNLSVCGIMVQKTDHSSEVAEFSRVGFAIVTDDGEIANSTWYLRDWKPRPWAPELSQVITIK